MTDDPILVDAEAAAVSVSRPATTIRYWAHRGWITRHPNPTGRRPRILFDLAEVHTTAERLDQTAKETTDEPHPRR